MVSFFAGWRKGKGKSNRSGNGKCKSNGKGKSNRSGNSKSKSEMRGSLHSATRKNRVAPVEMTSSRRWRW